MKVIFIIPDDIYPNKDVQHIIDQANEDLGRIDERITVQDAEEEAEYEYGLAEKFRDKHENAKIIEEDNEIIQKIARKIEEDVEYANGWHLHNGGYANVKSIVGVRYIDEDGKEKIRVFVFVEHGVPDLGDGCSQKYEQESSSDWTVNGELIRHFDD